MGREKVQSPFFLFDFMSLAEAMPFNYYSRCEDRSSDWSDERMEP